MLSPACVSICQQRDLSVHEHVSMSLLKDAGVPVPNFGVAKSAEEAKKIAEEIATNDLVVKAQVLYYGDVEVSSNTRLDLRRCWLEAAAREASEEDTRAV